MKFLRVGICALVVFGVASHGAVEDWARAILETGAGLLFLAWAVWLYFHHPEEQPVPSPLLPPLAAFSFLPICCFCSWRFRPSGRLKIGGASCGLGWSSASWSAFSPFFKT